MKEEVFYTLKEIKDKYFPNTHFHEWETDTRFVYNGLMYDVEKCACGARRETTKRMPAQQWRASPTTQIDKGE